jgi:hypothetical protein
MTEPKQGVFDRQQLIAFATGNGFSQAFAARIFGLLVGNARKLVLVVEHPCRHRRLRDDTEPCGQHHSPAIQVASFLQLKPEDAQDVKWLSTGERTWTLIRDYQKHLAA